MKSIRQRQSFDMGRRLCLQGAVASIAAMVLKSGRGAPSETAGDFITAVGRELSSLVRGADEAERRAKLRPFLARVVDLDRVGRFCFGRYWRLATPAQRAEYQQIFLDALTTAVAARSGSYGGDTKIIALPEAEGPDGTLVRTIVQTAGQAPVTVAWLVETSAKPYRILDVMTEGISLRLALRSDYTAFLDQHGGDIDLFLRTLRQHAGGPG